MKYTAEEVLAIAKRLHDDITVVDGDALMASDMLTAYAALVEAMKLPDGYEVVEHLPGIWGYEYDRDDGERMASSASWNHPALAAIGAWRDHVEALAESAEPVAPAQATQVDPAAKPRTLADFVNAPDAERVQVGQQVATRVDEMMAEPAAQGEVCKICGKDTPHHHLRGIAPTPAPPIDLAAVREVIESHINEAKKLRHDPESQDYLYEQADKLEAALPDSKP